MNGRDELGAPEKAGHDEYYLRNGSFLMDLRILAMTVLQAVSGKGIKH